ncbi:MAG: C10 family peptidase, partial [Bacteroidetes bacterium]|nr:C10 family peptidase [Bacteroidota bacterium]
MKKVSNILLILLITVFSNTLGQSVSKEEALVLANNFFSILSEKYSDPQAVSNEYVYLSDKSSEPTLYIFNAHSEGFVIIAADKKVYPVLGYSFNSKLPDDKEQWSPSFEAWIEMYSMQIDAIRIENSEAEKSITEAWHKLETKENPFLRSEKDVSPLLSTTWNQGCGYNALCPVAAGGPCGRAYTGCVATAMAQVMRYMAYPTSGIGSQCYDTANYGELCANFADGIYNYAAMTNNSGNSHVAKLMYHCGISVYMSYSASGSGAFSHNVVRAWKQFFDYKNHILIQKSNYAEVDWIRIIRNEIDKNRPVYYAGFGSGGHAFVFDGYQNLNHFHVNWGWGGSHNGYFYVNNLNPGGYTFTNSQQAIVGTIPGISFTNLDVSSAVTLTCATPASGDISTGVDHINYYKNSYPAAVGKELVYTFSNDLPGRIRIKITNNVGGDVNAFLLHYPHQDSLVTSGKNGLIADDMPASTYYVVVEGDKGKEPTFNIEVICPTIEADLIFLQSNVSPQFIESFLPNVMFSSIVKNIGNTDAASCTIEYYLSVDEFFDGSDILLGSDIFSETSIGQTISFSSSLTMPAGLISGSYYVIFNLDPENSVPESDDDNFSYAYVMVPTDGIMDCTASIILEDGLWHYGNTLSDGASNITMYWSATEMTGPEVIHSFTPSYNGFTKLTFVETHPGTINAMVLPICNENTYLTNVWFANITDTIGFTDFYSVAGTKYYVVVDGYKGVYGDYALKVDLPKECPDVTVEMSKDPNLCDGETFPSFWTNWGASSYQWYKDGAPIQEATKAWFSPTAVGSYFVEITENGCSSASDIINLQMSFPPDAAQIAHNGSLEFCLGGNVELYLSNTVSYPLNWALNGVIIDGATNETFIAEDSGTYSLITTNGSCSVTSENSIIVNAKRLPANINEKLSVPSENIKFQYTFEEDNTDQSGNNYNFVCWSFQPTNDRFGNFWQARYFTSDNVMGYSSNSHALHNEFTHSLWFKTDTDKGGLITGFVNNPWNATIMESMLYMSNSGNLHFYITNSGTPVELISSDSYNDNQWHSVTIQYNGNMKMIINNGMELLENTNSIQKLNITGYWAFAGPNIPSNATDMPTSKYFDGSIDDMICVYESNNLLDSYNYFLPALTVENDGSDEYCLNALISFNILNSEINTEYRIWNQTKEEWYSNPVIGTFGQINITGNDDIIQTTDFKIHANNLLSGCERFLDTVITININPATEIIMQPTGEEICIGNNYTFNIVAIGHSLSYQWKKDGADIGENQPSLTISNADNTDEAFYSCEVTGSCGSVISNEVYLTIADEFIIDEITDATLCEGANASFEVVANGSNKTYQWKKDGVDLSDTDEINGTNTNNLIIENISSADEGNYSCFVTSDCGNGISNEASLTVLELTQISQQPEASYDACENTELTLYIEASGAGINYQWYKNNNPIPEANSSSYHIPNILAEDEGEYYCIVSGICSDEQSITSFLTVYANPIGGQVVNDAEITYGNSTGILNLFGESGAVVGWERKLESMDWEFIENTESFYSEIPINIGTWKYRAIIENGNCNPVYSDEATITVNAREVTISGLIVEDKVYDGTNAATVSNWGTLVDILSEDDVILDFTNAIATFPLTLVGLDYEIVITGIVINGNDAHNYLLNMPLITACITAKPLAITAQSFLKSLGTEFVFDGDEFFVSEMIAGDEVIAVTLTSAGAPIGALEGEYDIVP